MAQKCLECLVVDGNYSKARIGALLLGLISIALFIWLIVLTVKLGKDEEAEASAKQDFEWNKIAVTCSDEDDNKINTEVKNNLDECRQFGDSNKAANFIFFSDDKHCTIYKGCDKMKISNKPGITNKKKENKQWDEYERTCGEGTVSFQLWAIVDSLEKCQEEASKSEHGKFIFFSKSSSFKKVPGCYFYDECDPTNVHRPLHSGETYEREIKNNSTKN